MAALENNHNSTNNKPVYAPLIFNNDLQDEIKKAKLLVVGAGGIGCELLKNLVLTGFEDIEIIDLDTIDVSNLNRQFLFQKNHVGMSKAEVARQSVLQFNPKAKIIAHHASVTSSDFGVGYVGKFNLVLNALDNRKARNHVNRVCLAAGIPLVESGTSGYNGQVELILKSISKCYECEVKPAEKTFPGCTIRNTPSQLIHCIVWAKHLFNQLFGEHDPNEEDQDVSPDPNDEEAAGSNTNLDGPKKSTREWAKEIQYAPEKLFTKLFEDDIKYLLSLHRLWENRQPPVPLSWENATCNKSSTSQVYSGLPDQKVWTLPECAAIFKTSLEGLKTSMEKSEHGFLVWDKDEKPAMDFVASAANIRAHIFSIQNKSRFDIKAMAGNIVPAIATSNAAVAGLIVLNALNILRNQIHQCQPVYLRELPAAHGALVVREKFLDKPNPMCTVCSPKPQITIATDLSKMKLKDFESTVLKEKLNMIEPDVQLDSTGAVIISSEEGETEHNNDKNLKELGIHDGTILQADDFVQNYKLTIIVRQKELQRDDPPFFIVGDLSELKPQEEKKENGNQANAADQEEMDEDDDDLVLLFAEEEEEPKKRKLDEIQVPAKKRKIDNQDGDCEIIIL